MEILVTGGNALLGVTLPSTIEIITAVVYGTALPGMVMFVKLGDAHHGRKRVLTIEIITAMGIGIV
jgi:hypothetical protein